MTRAFAMGAANYSTTVVGMPDFIVQQAVAQVRMGTSTVAKGSSASLDLLMQKSLHIHPLDRAIVAPAVQWARLTYFGTFGDERKQAYFRACKDRTITAISPRDL